jgi:hypothetical protein
MSSVKRAYLGHWLATVSKKTTPLKTSLAFSRLRRSTILQSLFRAAVINYGYLANAVLTTEEAVTGIELFVDGGAAQI